ncbi:MAG TPA: HAD-IIIA family hydrolase [Thermoanaerobaculia bacterium]|nr:HAD-IIIA family hydrolase [Thermoanaerobaculia bacterium]
MPSDPKLIRLIISDLDGVWTDGRIIYSGETRETKEFNVRDGLGVKIAQAAGIEVAILTSRLSEAVERRCRELGIDRVIQGAGSKGDAFREILESAGLPEAAVCYIGDDLPDLAPLSLAGLSAAPSDAVAEVLEIVDWPLEHAGGTGAFRELVERLLRARGEWKAIVEGFNGAKIEHSGA